MRLSLCLVAALVTVSTATAAAQTTSKPVEKMEHHGSSGWKELDVFHTVMAATWHPVSASGDFTAIRAQADSLAATARRWAASRVPAACDTKPLRDAIADVAKGSDGVAKLVAAKAADADLRKALHDVHERFEVVEKGCHP